MGKIIEDSDDDEGMQQTWASRLINILICRGDLAHEKLEAQPVPIKELFRYSTRKDKLFIGIGVILAVAVGVLQSTTCLVTGYISNLYLLTPVDQQVGNDELWWSIAHWCIADGILAIIMIIISYLQSWFFLTACTNIVKKMRFEYVNAVLRQDAAWFDGNDAGLISSQLNNNIERIRDGVSDKFGLITRGFALFIFSTIFSFVVNWRVTLVCFGLGPLGAITMGLMARCSAGPMKDSMNSTNEAGAIAEESIMNVKTVAACNGQETMIQKYSKILNQSLGKIIRLSFLNGFFEGLMFFELYLLFVFGLLLGITVYFNNPGIYDPGTIIMAANTTQMGGYFMSLLGPHMMTVLKARVAAAVIYQTIDRTPKIDPDCENGQKLTNCRGKIEFQDVHFKYPTRETKILTGCTWTAEAGETIAFVGHSGCGKSTSIGLLTRLYEKCQGQIRIDGVEVEKISVRELRKTIGIVQQEPCLFNGTIKENIVLGRTISGEKVEDAARIANAHEFIMKLQDGYETILGVGGVALSGGQKQRIAIARAIAADPKILLLDEATSALDSESERVVQLALTKASRGRTTILIAHRLSTLKDVNRIHVIDKGKVVEIGSHMELLAQDGLYAALAKAQEVGLNSPRSRKPSLSENFHLKSGPGASQMGPLVRSSLRQSVGERRTSTVVTSDVESINSRKTEKLLAFFCSVMRGLELPAFSFLQILPFLCLQQTADNYHGYLLSTCVSFFVLGLFTWVFLITAIGFGGWASEATVNNIRVNVLRSLLHRDAAYFDQPHKSNAASVTNLSLNAANINACLDYRFMLLINNLTGVVVCLFLTYINTWQTGVTSTILIGGFILLLTFFSRGTDRELNKKGKVDTTAEFAIEIFEQARTIQLLSVENYFTCRYGQQQDLALPIERKLNIFQSATFMLTISFVFISDFFCFLVGATNVYYGNCTSAHAVIAAFTANFAGWSVIFASPTFNDLIKAASSARTLFGMIGDEPGNIDEGLQPELSGSVNVEKVSFAYPARPEVKVAKGLNLRVEPGESIALVGASGCGKSTVIQLLERFYTPDGGQIKMSNHNILDVALRHLRSNVALVGQEPILFRGSIYENITLGCESETTIEDVKRVAEVANAAKFVEAFPGKSASRGTGGGPPPIHPRSSHPQYSDLYDILEDTVAVKGISQELEEGETHVGEKGRSLSGGQKQRIAIARALIRDPKLLLLDEATSALDTESEKKVQKALNEASSGRTSITIAHRLSTIRNANRIYFIENGGVVEYGTHDELIEAEGKYAKLVAAQALQTE